MGIKESLSKTLEYSEKMISKSIDILNDKEQQTEVKQEITYGSKPCSSCGAPVKGDRMSCEYCGTSNGHYVNHKDTIQSQDNASTSFSQNQTNNIKCPYCQSTFALKKERSVGKHAVAALATGGLSLLTLAIPNKKYKCWNCGQEFKTQ